MELKKIYDKFPELEAMNTARIEKLLLGLSCYPISHYDNGLLEACEIVLKIRSNPLSWVFLERA